MSQPETFESVADDQLRLIFTCCHPALPRESQVALTLKLIAGFSTEELARAFLCPETTIAQRIVRAKRTIDEKRLPYEVPGRSELRAAKLKKAGESVVSKDINDLVKPGEIDPKDLENLDKLNALGIRRIPNAYGKDFKIQVSDDNATWTDAYSMTGGTGGTQILRLATPVKKRYVRMLGLKRGTAYGYSLYELEVYGH